MSVAILASYTNVATGFLVHLRADITGHASANRWELGVGTVPSNRPNLFYSWGTAGDYPVVLRVYNESYPSGISATLTIQVLEQPTHYVALGNANPLPPCTSWSTAAANIQDAVDVAFAGGTVLVTNGVYDKGGRAVHGTLTNRVVVMKLLVLSSVNGPGFTVIQGYQLPGQKNGVGAVRCVYLAGDSKLVGFTLLTGVTSSGASESPLTSGGGIWCESSSAVVENCTVLSNSAAYSAGGAFWGTFTNCMFIRNNLPDGYGGGGVKSATLYSCIVASNSAAVGGGGAYQATLNKCLLIGNSAGSGGGGSLECVLKNCTLDGNKAVSSLAGGGGSFFLP